MLKELIVALICVVTFNAAARVPHGEPVKKQAVYTGYVPPYNVYQDPHYYPTAYPQSQVGVFAQGQNPQVSSASAGTTGTSAKQPIVPQKSAPYPSTINSVGTQYPSYPFKQYYPQIYPQNSQYPSVPSVFYVPSQGRFPANANEGAASPEQGTGAGTTGGQGGSGGSWFGNNWSSNVPSWGSQVPQFPASPPTNFPQFPSNFPQFPSNFPQFPAQYPQFPSSFPSGNIPAFPGNAPASSIPAGGSPSAVSGSEAGSSALTNTEGNSVVVVGARRPEKIENADSNAEGTKNDADFPAQQYILLGQQPQYVLQNGGQIPASGKEPVQLDNAAAAKGAGGSGFLYQQQQPVVAQQAPVQQFPHIPHNKIFSPQEFQELIQQIQASNKKLIESNNGAVPQFYVQQGYVPQRGVPQPNVAQGASQDVQSQQVAAVVPPQQYLFQSAPPAGGQVQQPFIQFSPQQPPIFVPQYSVPQQKPFAEVPTVPGVQNVEGGASVNGAGTAAISVPSSAPSTASTNDSSSSPEPSSNDDNDSTANTSDSEAKNETNEIPVNDDLTPSTENDSSATVPIKQSNGVKSDDEQPQDLEFGVRLNSVRSSSA